MNLGKLKFSYSNKTVRCTYVYPPSSLSKVVAELDFPLSGFLRDPVLIRAAFYSLGGVCLAYPDGISLISLGRGSVYGSFNYIQIKMLYLLAKSEFFNIQQKVPYAHSIDEITKFIEENTK